MFLVDRRLVRTIQGLLKFSNQSRQTRREDDQISGTHGFVGVGSSGRNEYGSSRADVNNTVDEAKPQRTLKYVPRLIISVMDVQSRWATSSPLVDCERLSNSRKTSGRVSTTGHTTRDSGLHHNSLDSMNRHWFRAFVAHRRRHRIESPQPRYFAVGVPPSALSRRLKGSFRPSSRRRS